MLIELPADAGIKTIKRLYLKLVADIKKEPEIIMDFKNIRRIDLALAQMIMAANRELNKNGKQFMVKSVSKNIKKQLYLAGFSKQQ